MFSFDRRELAAVFVGGALGTLARAAFETLAAPDPGRWPWPTFTVNIVGAFLSGLLHHPAARTVAGVELSAPAAGHRTVRWPDHVLDDAGRDSSRCSSTTTTAWPSATPPRSIAAGLLALYLATALVRRVRIRAMTVAVWAGVVVIGGVGAVLRFLVDRTVSGRVAGSFPYGTLVVNLSGALLLGFLSGLALSPHLALLAGTAFVGSYTTFSTWMLETQRLGEERQCGRRSPTSSSAWYVGLAAAWLGHWIGAAL